MSRTASQSDHDHAFALLVACCDWPGGEQRNVAVRDAHEALDGEWHPFLVQVKRHQMSMLVADALRSAGIDAPENLHRIEGEQKIRALSLAGEAVQLIDALGDAGIKALIVKGPLLSQMLYRDPTMRQSLDLDLLVEWEQFRAAREALTPLGYQLISNEPPWDDWRIEPWRQLAKDITLFHPEREISLELHHRLKSPESLLPGFGLERATGTATMAGRQLPAFERADLFAYLCVHAATSLWDRLKWLADIRALLAGSDEVEIAQLQAHSEHMGTGRCTALGLLLCHRLWGQALPPEVQDRPIRDHRLAGLEKASMERLRGPERRPGSIANSLDRRHLRHLRDDRAYRRAQATEFIYDNELLEEHRIPHALRFLYLPLRLNMFIQRKLGMRHNPARVALARAAGRE